MIFTPMTPKKNLYWVTDAQPMSTSVAKSSHLIAFKTGQIIWLSKFSTQMMMLFYIARTAKLES